MENGYVEEKLADKMSGLGVNEQSPSPKSNDSLVQVMKAVEAAEATIKQQVEENNRLRDELQRKMQELDRYRLVEAVPGRHHTHETRHQQCYETPDTSYPVPSMGNRGDHIKGINSISPNDPAGTLVLHKDQRLGSEGARTCNVFNEALREFPGDQTFPENAGMPRISSPSAASFSPKRYQMGDHDPQSNMLGLRMMPVVEENNSNDFWKQDLFLKVREQEEEIMLMKKRISEYSIKEAQIRNEKYVLEKRISYMRLAFDQQQQDLVDAASKALSYRQDIIEENIRLTYMLQAAQQERTTYVSFLLALLAEYSLQPPVPDAQSIVSSIKVLIKHLQEKLMLTESKLKDLQYQVAPWPSDANHSNMAPQSPSQSNDATLTTSTKRGLELVSQPPYSHGLMPVSSEARSAANWDVLSQSQSDFGVDVPKNLEQDDLARYSPLASRNPAARDTSPQPGVTGVEGYATQYSEQPTNKQVMFRDPVSSSEMGDSDIDGHQNDRETPSNWAPGSSSYSNTLEDPSSYSPYLPPVPEDPSSSYSEAADDDPLPAIEGLQISGEPFPGRELQACGYSVNGTTSCNFEWVRHLEDGSVNYIDGAKQPNYLVTADDVNAYLAIEVQPLDNRKRKGELVKVFANEHRKITCDPEMQSHIEKNLHNGQVSYKVSLPTGYLDIWEPATLAIKRDAFSIKGSGSTGVVVTEKFTRSTIVTIPYGHPTEFSIVGSDGEEHLLRADNSSDISCLRDTIVVTLRLFIMRAAVRKSKKKKLFFH